MEHKESIGLKVGQFGKAFGEYTCRMASKCNLPRGSFRLFPYLDVHRDEDVTQKNLCEHTKCKASTISVLIDDLEKDGYLQKSKSKHDSRKTIIKLTDKGTEAAHQIKSILEEVDRKIESVLTEEERETLISAFIKMSDILKGDE